MTNREKLIKTNIYDLLCKINDSFLDNEGDCILTALGVDICVRCKVEATCTGCIAKWLNEEAR